MLLRPPRLRCTVLPGRSLAVLCLSGTLWTAAAAAPGDGTMLRTESQPTSSLLGYERVHMAGGETLGLIGGSLLFEVAEGWGAGPAAYGAATGARGGLFVGGLEVQRRWALGPGWTLATGLFAGGGGGAAAPVGGGLMLRPAVTLLRDLGPQLQAGLSWSQVRFPSGDIQGSQLGVVLAWRNDFKHYTGGRFGDPVPAGDPGGLGFERIAMTASEYRISDGSGRRFKLIGARAERRAGTPGLTWGLEAAGATGNASGYMEILGTVGASVAPLRESVPSWRIGVRASGGLGGGGAVPTGGGVFGKLAATTEIRILPGWTMGLDVGELRGRSTVFRAKHAQLWLATDLEPALDGVGDTPGHLVRTEWTTTLQHHLRVRRTDGSERSLDTIGIKLSRYGGTLLSLADFYVTGQAHSAFAGGAGAYSVGLIGAGLARNVVPSVRVGAELLAGAAGGGGVKAAGGALVQGVAWAGWTPLGGNGEWRVGLGSVRSVRSGVNSPLAELSWAWTFGLSGR